MIITPLVNGFNEGHSHPHVRLLYKYEHYPIVGETRLGLFLINFNSIIRILAKVRVTGIVSCDRL